MAISITDSRQVINDVSELLDIDERLITLDRQPRLNAYAHLGVKGGPSYFDPVRDLDWSPAYIQEVGITSSPVQFWLADNRDGLIEVNQAYIRWLLMRMPQAINVEQLFSGRGDLIDQDLLRKYIFSLAVQGDEAQHLADTNIDRFWEAYAEYTGKRLSAEDRAEFSKYTSEYVPEKYVKQLQHRLAMQAAPATAHTYADLMVWLIGKVGVAEAQRLVINGVGVNDDAVIEGLALRDGPLWPLSLDGNIYETRHGLALVQVAGPRAHIEPVREPIMI